VPDQKILSLGEEAKKKYNHLICPFNIHLCYTERCAFWAEEGCVMVNFFRRGDDENSETETT